jgi:hypothetical protein
MVLHLFTIVLVSLFLLTISCISVDPYKYFEDQLQAQVGESIDDAFSYPWRVRPDLLFTEPLSNGKIEYHYAYENLRGLCRYVLEVDPTTRKIVDWRYDGEDKDKACFVNPYP